MAAAREARTYSKALLAIARAQALRTTLDAAIAGHPGLADGTVLKTATTAMTTSDPGLGDPAMRAWLAVLRRRTLLGQIDPVQVPPYLPVPNPTTDVVAGWVGEGQPAPFVRLSFERATTEPTSLRFILPFSKELVRATDARAVGVVERYAMRELRRIENRKAMSDDAAVAGLQPAGLLNGVSAIGGGSPASLAEDVERLVAEVADGDADRPVFIASPRAIVFLSVLRDGVGPWFPNARVTGGDLAGIPLVASHAAGHRLVLLDASRLIVSDEGLRIEPSESAACLMDDAPTSGAVQLVSAYQTDSIFIKFTRSISWRVLGDDSIAFVELPIGGSPS
jgi:hypothetical protein